MLVFSLRMFIIVMLARYWKWVPLMKSTHMLFSNSGDSRAIKQPVGGGLVLEGNATDMFASVHIPRSNAHT